MGENYKCDGVACLINGILYAPKPGIDGEWTTPVEYAPLEWDAFEYMPNYDAWIENYLI